MNHVLDTFLTFFASAAGTIFGFGTIFIVHEAWERIRLQRESNAANEEKQRCGTICVSGECGDCSWCDAKKPEKLTVMRNKHEQPWTREDLDALEGELKLKKPWHPDFPRGCRTCGTTDRPHKAKGQDKRCYEREQGRERRAKVKAKASSRR